MDLFSIILLAVKIVLVFGGVLTIMIWQTWAERKVIGHMQLRVGPSYLRGLFGALPFGFLVPLADGVKLLTKEDIIPTKADRSVFVLAPLIGMATALAAWVTIPFGPQFSLFGHDIAMSISSLNIGVLYILALTSVGVYAIVLAGWSSNSKYALLGGLRASAQIISYELAMGLSIIVVILMAGSLNLTDIVNAQGGHWYLFTIQGFVAAVIFLITMIAETNRAPFDMAEAETELVAGFHTEYSGFRFALFFMAEYMNMMLVSCMMVVLFFGGWNLPFMVVTNPLLGVGVFVAKVFFFLFLFYWIRATLPRLRYNELMKIGWKVLIPITLANILFTAIIVLFNKG